MVRNLTFGAIAAALVVGYALVAAQLVPVVGPTTPPTPTPARPAEQTGAPRVPGAIAFVLRGDVYVLRDGRYAPLTSEGRSSQPHLTPDGATLYYARQETIDGRRISDGAVVNARLAYTAIVRKPSGGGTEEIVVDGLRLRRADGFHEVSWYLGPALAPDGRRLAVVEDDGDGAADLQVIAFGAPASPGPTPRATATPALSPRPAATPRPTVTRLSQGADLADPAWSPDGRTIALTTYNTDTPGILLWTADRVGVAERIEDLPDGETYRPSYSPDGAWLVYTLRRDGRNDLHAYHLATGRDVGLTSDGHSWNGVFSPDGKWVAFLREQGGSIDLYAMEIGEALSGGTAKDAIKLTRGEGIDGASRPSWGR
jgi:Tol biopolymer transport system component